jgi:hypothetical protein
MNPRRALVAWSLAVLAILVPRSAELGQIHSMPVELDEVLQGSPLVVVARQAPQPLDTVTLSLGDGVQPFTYAQTHWEVVAWLRPARPAPQGERITVSGFDGDTFARHVSYYLHGIDESPILPSYTPEHPPAAGEAMILFLHRGAFLRYDPATQSLTGQDDTLMPTFQGAVEGVAGRDEVVARIARAEGPPDRLELVIGTPEADEATREHIEQAITARYAQEAALGWTVVDTRPQGHR